MLFMTSRSRPGTVARTSLFDRFQPLDCRSWLCTDRKRKAKTILRRVFNLHFARNIVICVAGSNQTGNLFALLKTLFERLLFLRNRIGPGLLLTITIYDITTVFRQIYISFSVLGNLMECFPYLFRSRRERRSSGGSKALDNRIQSDIS